MAPPMTIGMQAFLDNACGKPTSLDGVPTVQVTPQEAMLKTLNEESRAWRVALAVVTEADARAKAHRRAAPPSPTQPPSPSPPPKVPKTSYNPLPKLALGPEYDFEHTASERVTTPMAGQSRTATYKWNGKLTTVTVQVQILRYEPVERLARCTEAVCDHTECGDYIALRMKNWRQETKKKHAEQVTAKKWYAEDDEIRARGARCQSCGKEWQPSSREQFQWAHRGGKEVRNNKQGQYVANMPACNPFWDDVWLQCKKCHDSLPDWGGFRPCDHKFVLPSPKKGEAAANAEAEGQ